MSETNNVINDEEYVSMINDIVNSIQNYIKVTKGNCNIIDNNFTLLNYKYKNIEQIKYIFETYKANNENLDNFISDMKYSFDNLKILRKEYLNKISNYFNKLLTKINHNNNSKSNNNNINNYNKIMSLLISLEKYNEKLGYYSPKEKEEFIRIISLIINELKKNQNNNINTNKNNNINNKNQAAQILSFKEEINKLKQQLNESLNKNKDIKAKNEELIKNNEMKDNEILDRKKEIYSLKDELNTLNKQLKDSINENNNNKIIINDLKKENNTKNNKANEEIEKFNLKIKQYEEEITNYKVDYKILEIEKNELINQIKDSEQIIFKANNDKIIISDLESQISSLNMILNEKEKTIKDFNIKNNSIISENNEKTNIIEEIKKENKKIKEENEKLIEKQTSEYDLKIEESTKELELLTKEKNKLEEKLEENNKLLKEEKDKNKKLKEIQEQNDINIAQFKFQIDSFNNTINSKDELIQKLKNTFTQKEDDQISQYQKEIEALKEKNNNLLKQNDELKQSNMVLLKSNNPDILKISQSFNQFIGKMSINNENFDENTLKDFWDNNLLMEEENNQLKAENEKLKKKLEE